ncbi:DUF397 domain-containing protein [Streptomyces sp. ATCC51928]|uniref:DUF397 domain-containing protein n=1 Tax=Streptomyces caviscabies TaxID=90079 RepID=A0ABW2M3W6_9ACTN|nr:MULTISPECIES: DUF397 domain-containing protein [unclassified Streptomyces]MCL6287006.1 DUF397 domain-containing protein [Streptomyces sp. 43Y-GA-1]MDX3507033.1 DUF397 domain-containing protein [Streptomyces sp. ATCC51928]
MRMLWGQFVGGGRVGGVGDLPTVSGRMSVEQSARVVRVAGGAVRDSKAVDSPVIAVPVTAFVAFVAGVEGGAFD